MPILLSSQKYHNNEKAGRASGLNPVRLLGELPVDGNLFPVLPHLDGNVSPQGHLQLILQPGQVSIRLRARLGLAHQMAHQGFGLAGRQVMLQNVQGRFTLQFRRRQL